MELNPRTELPPRSACQEILPSLAPIRSVSPDWRAYNATTPLLTTVKVAKPPTIYALPRSIPTRISTLLLQTATDVPRRNRQHLQRNWRGLGAVPYDGQPANHPWRNKIHAQQRADHAFRWQRVSHRLLPAHREQVALPKRLHLIFWLYIMGGVNTNVTTHTEVP